MSADSRVVAIQPQMARDVQVMTSQALLERREIVQRVIEEVMVEGLHYGIVPGTRELSLLKEGAEVLLSTFHIAVEPIVTDCSTPTEVRFQVECRGLAGGQVYVGSGMGVCSSNEEKYRWRSARSAKEWEKAVESNTHRIKYTRDSEIRQVRQSPWDVFQTIMSMAKKRGMVDLAKTALAASECLKKAKLKRKPTPPAGDQSRAPPSHEGGGSPTAAPAASKTAGTAPQGRTAQDQPRPATSPPKIDPMQAREIADRLDSIGIPENAFLARFELGTIDELPLAQLTAAQSWIAANES